MDINELTIGQARELAAMFGGNTNSPNPKHGAIGQVCIVRTYASGVHFGTVMDVQPNDGRSRCELRDARRLWSWGGAFTLSGVAMDGIDLENSKLSRFVPQIFLEDAIEFIPVSETTARQLQEAESHDT